MSGPRHAATDADEADAAPAGDRVASPAFGLGSHNPDVLTCIANLSNDEVFTPPALAAQMLDAVAEAWADAHDGASIWSDPGVVFLDPVTKSGVFLREIASRLIAGLESSIPDLQARVDHILTRQVFGIGITRLTSLLARRSVYCSKLANGPHSISTSFDTADGNVWFEPTEHAWEKRKRVQRVHPTTGVTETVEDPGTGRCRFCGASESAYARDAGLETHAYAFIHTDDIRARIGELFGADMQFDVIIGNPPYQLSTGGGTGTQQAKPIYHLFIERAQELAPRFVAMVTPSRWFTGGMNLDAFRQEMLASRKLRRLVDFPDSRDAFDGVDIAGGVSYFLWDAAYSGSCSVTTITGKERGTSIDRRLDEFEVFVRDNASAEILRKIKRHPDFRPFSALVSAVSPFGIPTSFRGREDTSGLADPIVVRSTAGRQYADRSVVTRNTELLDQWKVLLSATASEHAGQAGKDGSKRVLSRIELAEPGVAMTHSYLSVGPLRNRSEAVHVGDYLRTRLVRFLASLAVITQHVSRSTFAFVPTQDFSRPWSDSELAERYGLTEEEIAFIEGMIRPMETVPETGADA